MKKLITWVLCLMMCFSTVVSFGTPVTALAKSKCAHKHTQWVSLVKTKAKRGYFK